MKPITEHCADVAVLSAIAAIINQVSGTVSGVVSTLQASGHQWQQSVENIGGQKAWAWTGNGARGVAWPLSL